MSAIFCCTHPRSYSPTSELGAVALPVRSLSPSYGRRKTKRAGPGRRQSRQDIEAFYQEGKRLQEVEESRDNKSEISYHVPMQDGMSEGQTELLNRSVISGDVSGKAQELEDGCHIPSTPKPRSEKMIAPPIRASSIPRNHTPNLNSRLMKLASQISPSPLQTPSVKLFSSPRTCNSEASASMKEATLQLSHSEATTMNQIEQQMAQMPSYEYKTEGNGCIKFKKNDEDAEQDLDIEEVSNLYNNVEALKPGNETASDINPPISENCCPQSSILSKMHINELVGQSDSSLSIDSIGRDQTPIARAWNTKESCEISMVPLSSLAGRDKTRVYLDSSSSYYTSNASSFRSSIDLTISPVPPIPDSIIARMASSRISPLVHSSVIPSLREVPMDNLPYREIEEGPNPTYDLETDQRYLEVGLAFDHEKGVVGEGDSSLNIALQTGEISKVKDHGSSVWDAGSTRRPLLTEAGKNLILVGDKKWNNSDDKLDKRGKIGHKKSYSNGVITDDIKNWLDEQHIIRLSPMSEKKSRSMTFKKTFTKGVSKLRNRLSSNLKPTGALPLTTIGGTARHAATDGRGEFSRLHTPTESVTTDRTTVIGDYINAATEDVTPNSEQVMANITFTPSLPTELRLDGSLEDYDDFQTAELIVQENTTSCSPSKLAPTVGSFTGVQNGATAAVNQNRYSAIYDDCVIFPFSSDGDESGDEEESKSDYSLTMTRAPLDCLEVTGCRT